MDVTDAQWAVLHPIIPAPPRRPDGRGRSWRAAQAVLNDIRWILRTGAPWKNLPERYPSYQTCHRRFQQWGRTGVFEQVLQALANDIQERGGLALAEWFIDGTFVVAQKGAVRQKDQAGQRHAAHGHDRPRWSSSRRPR